MSIPSLLGLLFKFSFLVRPIKWLAGGLLSLAILASIAQRSGPASSEVVVHVIEPDVEVTVGDRTYRIEGRRYDPIVRDLPPGSYPLIMRRGNRVLFDESFEVRRDESMVLTAWDPNRLPSAPGPPSTHAAKRRGRPARSGLGAGAPSAR
jgi:hypothetical protein